MKNNLCKILFSVMSVVAGFVMFVILMDYLSKSENAALSFHPIDAVNTYFFAFAYSLGTVGIIFGVIILLSVIILLLMLGYWLGNKFSRIVSIAD